MNPPADSLPAPERPAVNDCWNRIGVRGDASCPELAQHIHCRNCPVFAAAAVQLLDDELPAGHLARWSRHVAAEKWMAELDTHSVVVFRVAAEWLALPTAVFKEIASRRPIHPLPHRRNRVVLGLANIRGELMVCVSLQAVLGLDLTAETGGAQERSLDERLLVMQYEGHRAVCPADEVYGIQRFHPRDLQEVPATVARATATYTRAILAWQGKAVGLLDEQLLFHTINRSLASATVI